MIKIIAIFAISLFSFFQLHGETNIGEQLYEQLRTQEDRQQNLQSAFNANFENIYDDLFKFENISVEAQEGYISYDNIQYYDLLTSFEMSYNVESEKIDNLWSFLDETADLVFDTSQVQNLMDNLQKYDCSAGRELFEFNGPCSQCTLIYPVGSSGNLFSYYPHVTQILELRQPMGVCPKTVIFSITSGYHPERIWEYTSVPLKLREFIGYWDPNPIFRFNFVNTNNEIYFSQCSYDVWKSDIISPINYYENRGAGFNASDNPQVWEINWRNLPDAENPYLLGTASYILKNIRIDQIKNLDSMYIEFTDKYRSHDPECAGNNL